MSGNVLFREDDSVGQRVLIINMRSHDSELLVHDGANKDGENNFFDDMLKQNNDLYKPGVPPFDVVQTAEMKLSADVTPDDWVGLAKVIQSHYHAYCGFVVQSGVDTMVQTASALSFMLENLGKPVVFTGSIIAGDRVYTDLKRNIILALTIANDTRICEVCILFDEKLFRANRTMRVHNTSLQPFDCPHFPLLATVYSGAVRLHHSLLRTQPHGELRVMSSMHTVVLSLQLGPALTQDVLIQIIQCTTAKAIILHCYGTGNGPTRNNYMRNALQCAHERSIVLVICTQNMYGDVKMSQYAAGSQLIKAGCIGAADMTPEAVLVKLKYLFGLGFDANKVRQYLLKDMRGEVTMERSRL